MTSRRDFPYEYEHDRLAIDLINGSELLRQWVDDPSAMPADLDALAKADENSWLEERKSVLLLPLRQQYRNITFSGLISDNGHFHCDERAL